MSKKDFNKTPQQLVSEFWDKYFSKKPGKVTSIFPRSLYATLLPPSQPRGASSARNAAESYETAATECREKVQRIVRECHRTNEKFTDPDFDIESDWAQNCLQGLVRGEFDDDSSTVPDPTPRSVHRVDWIFEDPQFTKDGFSSSDIKQGCIGDCWWVAAVATIANRKDLMNKICVARDEEVGVYGFVFYRDGEWINTVVDDNLYLISDDFDYSGQYDATGKLARDHKKRNQTGSEALFFSKCEDPNETWLPLMEKAYAKAHGDYEAIEGGYSDEAVEDMTGGVATTVSLNKVLKKDKLWKELVNADGEFVFSCSVVGNSWDGQKGGLATGHAYSIIRATEEVDEDGNNVRLVLIRNPWGERSGSGIGEWNGPWSDGSKEWTPYWLKKLNHTFGNDGVFWMSFADVLEVFRSIYRTRLFDEKWTVVQQWASVNVGWIAGYLNTKFVIDVKQAGTVVIVMAQLDDRYFLGLTGQYDYALHFLLQEQGGGEHICRARPTGGWGGGWGRRSVCCEVHLEPGRYEVLPKITSQRDKGGKMVEDVVKDLADKNPAKLRQVGMQYDLAHAKGGVPNEDEILTKKMEKKKLKEEKRKKRAKERARRERQVVVTTTTVTRGAVETKTEQQVGKKEEKKDGESSSKDEAKEDEKFEDAVEEAVKPEDGSKDDKKDVQKKDGKSGDSNGVAKKDEKQEDKKEVGKKTEDSEKKDEEKKDGEKEKKDEQPKPEGGDEIAGAVPLFDADSESDSEDEETIEYEEGHVPWNAVCVVGLRVYSKDKKVTVTLAEPKNAEEGASLVMDSQAVGSTM
ncbi:hypothetical protein B0H66DRAFT_481253 [Apodospora peruviana]|uniref:Calpain catalytic domain-containing protein n=1 Tax=Apodospora peruviana TaxID=516989 RepID=A0AAE0HXC5_9PEZI|nr:hypothetical protein B0H66DRAFT_481253 [Apodospora peruviana]